jgi:hypothetical protein
MIRGVCQVIGRQWAGLEWRTQPLTHPCHGGSGPLRATQGYSGLQTQKVETLKLELLLQTLKFPPFALVAMARPLVACKGCTEHDLRGMAPALRRRHGLVKVIGVRDRNRTQALATQCGGRLCSKCTRIIFQVDWVNTRCRVCSDAKNAKSAAAQAKKEAEAQGDLIVKLDEHIVQQEQLIDRVKLIYNRFVFQPRSLHVVPDDRARYRSAG